MNPDRQGGGSGVLHRTNGVEPRRSWHTWLIGRPLQTADAPHQTIGKAIGLAVFASDALSSTAYATQEILVVLFLRVEIYFLLPIQYQLIVRRFFGMVFYTEFILPIIKVKLHYQWN